MLGISTSSVVVYFSRMVKYIVDLAMSVCTVILLLFYSVACVWSHIARVLFLFFFAVAETGSGHMVIIYWCQHTVIYMVFWLATTLIYTAATFDTLLFHNYQMGLKA